MAAMTEAPMATGTPTHTPVVPRPDPDVTREDFPDEDRGSDGDESDDEGRPYPNSPGDNLPGNDPTDF
jgi:hypothetical protein